MLKLINHSNWQVGLYPGWSQQGQQQLTCVTKASYYFNYKGELKQMNVAHAINEIDSFYADPLQSSLALANEIMPFKQGAEILLTGTAHPRSGARTSTVYCELQAHNFLWKKTLYIFGRRYWKSRLFRYVMSAPELLTPLPLRYEFAFGGNAHNPAGLGYIAPRQKAQGLYLPQIEIGPYFIQHPMDHPLPAGFGPIAAFWQSRLHMPLILDAPCVHGRNAPAHFYNMAPADQRFTAPFYGNEIVRLNGFFPEQQQTIHITLPTLKPHIQWQTAIHCTDLPFNWDTLYINTDEKSLHLTGRAAMFWSFTENAAGTVKITQDI